MTRRTHPVVLLALGVTLHACSGAGGNDSAAADGETPPPGRVMATDVPDLPAAILGTAPAPRGETVQYVAG